MSSADEEWWEVRAGEYVLGTLDTTARDLFARTLRSDPALQASVRGWEKRFAPLDLAVVPRVPPDRVWRAIERRLFMNETPSIDVGAPVVHVGHDGVRDDGVLEQDEGSRVGTGAAAFGLEPDARAAGRGVPAERGAGVIDLMAHRRPPAPEHRGTLAPLVAALATAAALILGVMLNQQYGDLERSRQLLEAQSLQLEQQGAEIAEKVAALDTLMRTQGVSVIMSDDGQPLWLVQADFETERVRITALQPPAIGADEDFQLWQVLPEGRGVHPVALLPDSDGRSFESGVPDLARAFDAFAVSMEPAGGSPEAVPTGAVLYQGTVVFTEELSSD